MTPRTSTGWPPTGRVAVLLLLLTVGGAGRDETGGQRDTPSPLFEEDFSGELGPGWSWVREERGAWEVAGGRLVTRPLNGNLWGNVNTAKNLLLRPPPAVPEGGAGSFAVEVTIDDVSPDSTKPALYEQAGLLWYADDDNYAKLVREWYDEKWHAVLACERDGRAEYKEADCDGGPLRLRMIVTGRKVSGQFRGEQDREWKTLGEYDLPAKDGAMVGLSAHVGDAKADAEGRKSAFDDFVVRKL